MRSYEQYVASGRAKHGDKFSDAGLSKQFISAFNSGERVTVKFRNDKGEVYEVKRGTIGATTGWKPCFLLMLTSRAYGSSYTLSDKDALGTMNDWREYRKQELADRQVA